MNGKLYPTSFAFATAVIWGLSVFVVGVANSIWTGYGGAFLTLIASIYPGVTATATLGSTLLSVLYAIIDGAIGGFIFAWLYNFCACKKK